ncbi:MAG: GNAT family N-acetyltransferase [Anaerolineae bacterium]
MRQTLTETMDVPAYRIETQRLVIRCWRPADAPLLNAAVEASLDHLSPWMPWARGEQDDVEARVQRLRQWRAYFDRDEDYFYGIWNPAEDAVLGATGLHTRRGPGAREIGYWIHVDHINRGLATEGRRRPAHPLTPEPGDRSPGLCEPFSWSRMSASW